MMTKRGQEVLRLVLTFDKKVNLWRARTTMYPDLTWLLILPTTFSGFFLIEEFHDWLPNYDDEQFEWIGWMQSVIAEWEKLWSLVTSWPPHALAYSSVSHHTIPYHIKVSNLTNLCNNLEKSKYQFWQIHVTSDQLTTSCTGLHLGLCFTSYYAISKYQFWQFHVTSDQLTTSCTDLHLGLYFTQYHTISKYQFWQIHVIT